MNLPRIRYAAGFCLAALVLFLAGPAVASEAEPADHSEAGGQVTLPLDEYQRLLHEATTLPLSAPSAYAIGQSELQVVFHQREGHVTATVQARLEVETFADEWTLVALLSPGAALESATVNNSPVQLVQRAEGLFWLAEKRQKASLQPDLPRRFALRRPCLYDQPAGAPGSGDTL